MGRRDSVKRQMTPFPFTFPANTSIVPLETQSILALPEILLPANEEGSGAVTTGQPSERASERALAGAAAAGCGVMSSALVPSVSSSWLAGREGRREGTGRPAGRGRAQENKGCGGPPLALYGLWGIFSQAAFRRRGAMLALWPHSPFPPLRRLRPHYLGRNHTTAYQRSFIKYVVRERRMQKKRHKDASR